LLASKEVFLVSLGQEHGCEQRKDENTESEHQRETKDVEGENPVPSRFETLDKQNDRRAERTVHPVAVKYEREQRSYGQTRSFTAFINKDKYNGDETLEKQQQRMKAQPLEV
jgi:hypothetical protein